MALSVPPNATFPATVPISDWLSSPDVRGYANYLVAFRAFPPGIAPRVAPGRHPEAGAQ